MIDFKRFCEKTSLMTTLQRLGYGSLLLTILMQPLSGQLGSAYAQAVSTNTLPDTELTSPRRFLSGQITQTGLIPEPQLELEPPSPGIVGLDLVVRPHSYPFVKDVFEGTPADDQGIAPGDYIVAVNGISTFGKTRVQVDDQIPDRPGTAITFQIQRQGQLYQVKVTVASLRQLPLTTQNFFMAPSP